MDVDADDSSVNAFVTTDIIISLTFNAINNNNIVIAL